MKFKLVGMGFLILGFVCLLCLILDCNNNYIFVYGRILLGDLLLVEMIIYDDLKVVVVKM